MKEIYTSYTKEIQNKTFYFVKKFTTFPEFENVAPLLESYGMHTEFNKACSIACINDIKIRQQLFNEIEGTVQQAKVIDMKNVNFEDIKIAT